MTSLLSDTLPFNGRPNARDRTTASGATKPSTARTSVLVMLVRLLAALLGILAPWRTHILTITGFGFAVAAAYTFGRGWGFLATGVALLWLEHLTGDST